jgi:hypothetical protein
MDGLLGDRLSPAQRRCMHRVRERLGGPVTRRHSKRVWLLWAAGVLVLAALPVALADPAILVFVVDPELLAFVAGTAVLMLRASLAGLRPRSCPRPAWWSRRPPRSARRRLD